MHVPTIHWFFLQILSAQTTEDLRALLDSEEFEFRFDAGITVSSSSFTVDDCKRVGMALAMHFLIYNTKSEIDQLTEGLMNLGVLEVMKKVSYADEAAFFEFRKACRQCYTCAITV